MFLEFSSLTLSLDLIPLPWSLRNRNTSFFFFFFLMERFHEFACHLHAGAILTFSVPFQLQYMCYHVVSFDQAFSSEQFPLLPWLTAHSGINSLASDLYFLLILEFHKGPLVQVLTVICSIKTQVCHTDPDPGLSASHKGVLFQVKSQPVPTAPLTQVPNLSTSLIPEIGSQTSGVHQVRISLNLYVGC